MIAYFNRFSLKMTLAQAQGASHQGQCDDDVAALCDEPSIRRQRRKIVPQDIRAELREYGAWDTDDLADDDANWQRLVWIAAGDICEEHNSPRN